MSDKNISESKASKLVSNKVLENIRWIAIFGQMVAVLVVHFGFGFDLPLEICLGIIGVSVGVGLAQRLFRQKNDTLSRNMVFALLAYDIIQLALLVYFTGGLINPFAIMFLAPITVSATVLPPKHTLYLVSIVVVLASFLATAHAPLPWGEAFITVPPLYIFGLWAALVLTTIFIASYAGMVARQSRDLARGLAEARLIMAQEQHMVALGSLATAAAHKLGSPLNTITLIVHELEQMELKHMTAPEGFAVLKDDLSALKVETERCRQILAELNRDAISLGTGADETGGAGTGEPMPITALIESLIDERLSDVKPMMGLSSGSLDGSCEPMVLWRADLLHPLEVLIDNAAQFANRASPERGAIDLVLEWSETHLSIGIEDDGPGFSSSVLGRLGEPYNSSRSGENGHMGLGIFIAKTMVESLGGGLRFENKAGGRGDGCDKGACVMIRLPREAIEASAIEAAS